MPNDYFRFKQFTIHQDRCAMKVTTDACLFGAWVADKLAGTGNGQRCLDIGAGTGLLSLMIAQKNCLAIDAVEISSAAFDQASGNVQASSWQKQINLVHADILRWEPALDYHCIFSNPPFYEKDLLSPNGDKNRAHHDDSLKLSELLAFVAAHLLSHGLFFLLLPAKREAELLRLAHAHGLRLMEVVRVSHSNLHPPSRLMVMGMKGTAGKTVSREIFIRDERGDYTQPFVRLLTDYYLHF